MRKQALILVDLQNDFVSGGALAVPRGDEVIPIASQLAKTFDLVIATQDWHPADHGSFADQHPGRKPGDTVELAGLPQILWPVHCVQGTHGAEFVSALDMSSVTKVFQKGTQRDIDSYSGFYDNARRRSTGLGEYLKEQAVTDVYVLGLATDYCVKFTALDARSLGFRTLLVRDASRGVDLAPGDVDRAVVEMRAAGVSIVSTRELLQ